MKLTRCPFRVVLGGAGGRTYAGRDRSQPPSCHGWHLASRRIASQLPRNAPCSRNAVDRVGRAGRGVTAGRGQSGGDEALVEADGCDQHSRCERAGRPRFPADGVGSPCGGDAVDRSAGASTAHRRLSRCSARSADPQVGCQPGTAGVRRSTGTPGPRRRYRPAARPAAAAVGPATGGTPGAARRSCRPCRRRRGRRAPGGRRPPTGRCRVGRIIAEHVHREVAGLGPATAAEHRSELGPRPQPLSGRQHERGATLRPTVPGGPCRGGRRGWRDPRGCASAAGSRGSSPGAGCSAETSACSQLYLQVRAWDRRDTPTSPKHFRAAQKGPDRPGASDRGYGLDRSTVKASSGRPVAARSERARRVDDHPIEAVSIGAAYASRLARPTGRRFLCPPLVSCGRRVVSVRTDSSAPPSCPPLCTRRVDNFAVRAAGSTSAEASAPGEGTTA